MKKLLLLSVFLTSSCAIFWSSNDVNLCPRVLIERDNAYFVQKDHQNEDFLVELVGYDGYCFFDTRINHDKAIIKPVFKIKRLRPTDETDVMFSFYAETIKGPPEYLGKKTYFARTTIPLKSTEIEFTGPEAEVRIPPDMKYNFDINLGISLSLDDKIYNQRTFDIPL